VGGSDFPPSMFFEAVWETARHSPDLYWRMTRHAWERFSAGAVTRIADEGAGKPAVKVNGLHDPPWFQVEASWQTVKTKHPDAIWSPRDGAWYDHHGTGGGTGPGPGPHPARAALQQRLAEIERMYNAKPPEIDAARRQQLINQAFRDYEKQMGSSA
jgi:hypothetical protein